MIIQNDPELLAYVNAKTHPRAPKVGGFLEAFLTTCLRAARCVDIPRGITMALTGKPELFLRAYLGEARLNATAAARIAGYTDPEKEGWRVRQDPEVAEAIREFMAAHAMRPEEVIAQRSDIARNSTITPLIDTVVYGKPSFNLVGADGRFKPAMRYVKKVSVPDESVSIEMYDRMAALEKVGRSHALFVDRHKVEGTVTVGMEVQALPQRWVTGIEIPTDPETNKGSERRRWLVCTANRATRGHISKVVASTFFPNCTTPAR